jgi:hypothetical protein
MARVLYMLLQVRVGVVDDSPDICCVYIFTCIGGSKGLQIGNIHHGIYLHFDKFVARHYLTKTYHDTRWVILMFHGT